ncbi:MAG: SRPBCC family protein [Myxococcales bacterium]|nr:SRPBCC family protein [Myxococcales bacterium]
MVEFFKLWFGLRRPIDRRTYLFHGAALMAFKYCADSAALWLVTGVRWSPLDYLNPIFSQRTKIAPAAPTWFWLALAIWTLPFLWIGVSMTLRRLFDARRWPWLCLFFFVPVLNWMLMLFLCIEPSRTAQRVPEEFLRDTTRLRAAVQGVAAGVGIGAVSFALYVLSFKTYNAAVFLGTPFTMGAATGYFYNRSGPKPRTAQLGIVTIVIAGLATLLFAFEGLICVAMAMPIAIPIGMLGAKVGQLIAAERRESRPVAALLLLALPLSAVDLQPPPLREVLTSVEIDAPPKAVWPHVLGFTDLDAPPDWFFRLGIAYPVRARLDGTGVGAVRRCEFSTGPFVEPITAWEEPSRLAFDVRSQPPPLREWSPYQRVHAQHLLDTLRSRRGEFRLIPLPDGRTRLEGRTYYQLAMEPQNYWVFFAEALIHQIHRRVLAHIAREVRQTRERGGKRE